MRGLLTSLFIGAAVVYVAFGLLLYIFQERMVHLPQIPGREITAVPGDRGMAWQEIEISAADGTRLHGWYISAEAARGTVLFFHGNAGNISHRLESISIFHDLGLDVVIFDYRGYGRSEGRPTEAGLHRDAVAAAEWVYESLGADPARTVYFGRSLGGALAAYAASDRPPAALILESTFTSAEDLAADLYPVYPARLLTRLEYATADYLHGVERPVLVVHSPDDEIIPFRHAEGLLEAAGTGSELLRIRGDHNTGFLRSGSLYTDGLDAFFERSLDR